MMEYNIEQARYLAYKIYHTTYNAKFNYAKKSVIPGERCRLHITYFCTYVLIIVLFFAPFDTNVENSKMKILLFFHFTCG